MSLPRHRRCRLGMVLRGPIAEYSSVGPPHPSEGDYFIVDSRPRRVPSVKWVVGAVEDATQRSVRDFERRVATFHKMRSPTGHNAFRQCVKVTRQRTFLMRMRPAFFLALCRHTRWSRRASHAAAGRRRKTESPCCWQRVPPARS